MSAIEVLPFALLGAVMGLDVVSFPQAMISRPIVAATAAGALAGHAGFGLLAGAVLELVALETLPFGASRYPEWGSASVVAGALFATAGDAQPGALVLAVLAGIATGWAGGWSMITHRRVLGWAARRHRAGLEAGSRRSVVGMQLFGLTMDMVRAGVLTTAALLALQPVVRASVATWTIDPRLSRAVVLTICASVAGAAAWKILHAFAGARWVFLGGLALGLLLVLR